MVHDQMKLQLIVEVFAEPYIKRLEFAKQQDQRLLFLNKLCYVYGFCSHVTTFRTKNFFGVNIHHFFSQILVLNLNFLKCWCILGYIWLLLLGLYLHLFQSELADIISILYLACFGFFLILILNLMTLKQHFLFSKLSAMQCFFQKTD